MIPDTMAAKKHCPTGEMRRYGEKTFYFILCLLVSQLLSGEFSVFTVSSNMYKDKTCCGGTL
jgi:hypothetical protein